MQDKHTSMRHILSMRIHEHRDWGGDQDEASGYEASGHEASGQRPAATKASGDEASGVASKRRGEQT